MSDQTTKFADVLRFLNQADSAEDIAKNIQIPGEPDAGRKIADAIMAQKAAVGGMLRADQDLTSLSSVGPERLALVAAAIGKLQPGVEKVETERSNFRSLILQNPNYFGNIEKSSFKPVKKLQGDTSYEELACVGLNPPFDRLEGVIRVKKTAGYAGDICTSGSTEYVRFYVDLHGNGIYHDVGLASVGVHDIPGPKPLCYAVWLDFSSIRKFCTIENILKVRAILSWNAPPPANTPNFVPVWGNRVDVQVQIQPAYFFLFGDLVKEIDLAKINIPDPIGPVIHSLDPATKLVAAPPQPVTLAQKKEIYKKTDVPIHRFAFSQTYPLLFEEAVVPDAFLAGDKSALQEVGLSAQEVSDLVSKFQLKTDGDTSFEELNCVGLRPAKDVLEAVLTVKKQNGYSGSLCGNGSTEYVAFWMDFGDGAGFKYVGTTTVTVHDLKTIPANGVKYAVSLKANLSKWRVPCEVGARVARLRAILSWETPPPPNNPNYVPVWGNREECRVQLRPGQEAGHVPLILTVGDVPTNRIDQTTGLATGGMEIANFTLNQSPFGGTITITGDIGNPPDVFAGKLPFKYKIEVSRDGVNDFHPLTNTITVSTEERLNGNPIFCGFFETICDATLTAVDDGDGLGDGWYTYLESPTGVHTRTLVDEVLGRWPTNSAMEGMWKIRLTAKDPNTIDINTMKPKVYPGFAEVKVWIDNTAATAHLHITNAVFNGNPIQSAVDCGKFPVGTILSGPYSVHDAGSAPNDLDPTFQHFGGLTFTVLPTAPAHGAAVSPSSRAFPVVPTIGEDGTWTLDTHGMDACGYVIELVACDRTNYDSRGNPLCSRDEVGFCLETPPVVG